MALLRSAPVTAEGSPYGTRRLVSKRVDYALRTPHAGARRRCAWAGASHTAGVAVVEGLVAVTLHLQLGALGVVAATRLGGHEAQLRLPGPPADPAGVGLTGGDLTAPSFQYMSDGERLREWMNDPSIAWGKCHARTRSGGAAVVHRCGLVVSVPDDLPMVQREALAQALYRSVDEWRSVLLDWLETAHDQNLRRGSPPDWGTAIEPWLWTHDGQQRNLLHKEQVLTSYSEPAERAIDAAALQRVLELAGDLARPPLAWTLRRDATRQQWAGDYRRAVLDAGHRGGTRLVLPPHGQGEGERGQGNPWLARAGVEQEAS